MDVSRGHDDRNPGSPSAPRRGPAEETHRRPARARSENRAALSGRRRDGGCPCDADGQRRGGPTGPARAASGRRTAAGRWLGPVCRAARGDRALAGRRAAPHQDSQAAGAAGRRHCVSHAAPLRGPRAAVWEDGDDDPGPRRRARARAAGRHGLGRLAHAAGEEAAVSRLDLYRGALAPPLRLSHLRGNDGARDRSLRGRVGLLWRRLQSPHPG